MAPPGGVTALPCAICGGAVLYAHACHETHPSVCHPCGLQNLAAGLGWYDHADPEVQPQTLVLSPRDVAALARYQQRVQRLREDA